MRRCRASAEAFCGNFTIRDGRQELMPEHRVNSLSGRGSIASCVLGSVPDATTRAKVLKDAGGVQQRARIRGSLPPHATGSGLLGTTVRGSLWRAHEELVGTKSLCT